MRGVERLSAGGVAPFLIAADGLVLVDCGLPRRGDSVVAALGPRVHDIVAIVLTHGHPDHIGGVELLRRATGAPVVAGSGERGLLDGSGWGEAPRSARGVRWLMRGPRFVAVDRWVDDGESVAGVRVVATPGHSPGHIALLHEGVLVCGDALVTGDRPRESPRSFTSDRARARLAVRRLASLEPEWAVSAHGSPMGDAAEALNAFVARFDEV